MSFPRRGRTMPNGEDQQAYRCAGIGSCPGRKEAGQ